MSAAYVIDHGIAIITLDNPPVNSLGWSTRAAIVAAVQRALQDDSVSAMLLMGGGKVFCGGADIREFNSPQAVAEPDLHQMIRVIEQSVKPIVAAIHGVCMGGGLELALACHYRIAARGAQIALPEVKIGLLPGAGGTQRLPRLVGLELALQMIVSGNTYLSEQLATTPLFDAIIERNLLSGALTFAQRIAAIRPLPSVRERVVEATGADDLLQAARAKAQASAAHFPAPLKCVEAIAATLRLAFDAGIEFERELFMQLVQTSESKALRHAFFAERAASKIADVPDTTPTRTIRSAAVIGAGTMGIGIAMCFANAGLRVMLLDLAPELLEKGVEQMRQSYANAVSKGKLSAEQAADTLRLIRGTLSYDEISQADIVIEAVYEDMEMKAAVFRKLDDKMKRGAILASNTSSLDLNRIASFTRRAQDVVGLHFFSPAHVMKLLEVVRGAETSREVLASVMALSKKLKKTAVVSGVCDGFIGNRMIEQYLRQALFLLEEGALPEQIDRVMEQFGMAMGPFRMSDLAGNDIGWAIRKRRYMQMPGMHMSRIADLLCELGRYGQKTGAGWYDYPDGQRDALPSEVVNQLIVEHSAAIGIERRAIADHEIIERLVYALINEAADILAEGIAQRASDIDVVYLSGYGFPLFRGGPLFYADTLGLDNVVAAIEDYATRLHGAFPMPAKLLARLAAEGKTFN